MLFDLIIALLHDLVTPDIDLANLGARIDGEPKTLVIDVVKLDGIVLVAGSGVFFAQLVDALLVRHFQHGVPGLDETIKDDVVHKVAPLAPHGKKAQGKLNIRIRRGHD